VLANRRAVKGPRRTPTSQGEGVQTADSERNAPLESKSLGAGAAIATRARLAVWPGGPLLQAAGILLALALATLAQLYLTHRIALFDGLLFYALAVVLFLKVLASQPLLQAAIARPAAAPLRLSWPRAADLAAMLAAVTFLTAGENTVRPVTVVCWLGAIALTLYAASDPRPDLRRWGHAVVARVRQPPAALELRIPWLAVLVLGVVLVSAFYHFYQLDAIPADMTSDHAEKFLDIQDLLDGQRPWFFPRNTGREPMQFYLVFLVAAVRGVDHLSLKLVTASAGTLVTLFCFLFARQFFGNAVGLVAAFLAGVSLWEVATARVGLRFPFAPLFSAICLYLLFRALRSGQRRDYLLLGLALGAGLYGYTPFRIVVPLYIALALALTLVLRWRDGLLARLDLVRNGLLCYVVAAVVFLPLGRYMVDYPASFWGRALSRVATEGAVPGHPVLVFLGNVKNALLMFNWQGDVVWVNIVPNVPVLDPLTGALFLLGVVYAGVRLVRAREWIYAYLLLAIPVLTLSSTAAITFPNENPSVIRAGPLIPVVFVLAALPLVLAARQLRALLGRPAGVVLAAGLMVVSLGLVARWNYESYFITYNEQYRLTAHNSREMGQVVRGFAESVGSYEQAYHIPWPHWVDTRNIGTAAGRPRWNNALLTPEAIRAAAAGPTPQLYLLHPSDQASLELLRTLRPEGHAELHRSRTPGKDFVVYFVPAPPG